jgi:hypothetical protein
MTTKREKMERAVDKALSGRGLDELVAAVEAAIEHDFGGYQPERPLCHARCLIDHEHTVERRGRR